MFLGDWCQCALKRALKQPGLGALDKGHLLEGAEVDVEFIPRELRKKALLAHDTEQCMPGVPAVRSSIDCCRREKLSPKIWFSCGKMYSSWS